MTDWRANLVEDDAGLSAILREAKTVAVLGAKAAPAEPAYYVPAYLRAQGYRIRPVNPKIVGRSVHDATAVARLAEPRAHLFEAREERARPRHTLLDIASHVLPRVELGLLLKVADPEPLGRKRLAEEVPVDAGHDPEQRRLPRAVRPEDADLGPVEE